MSRVAIIRLPTRMISPDLPGRALLRRMLVRGFSRIFGGDDGIQSLCELAGTSRRIGIKINTIGGRRLSIRPAVAMGLAECLVDTGRRPEDILIWDRTGRELKEAGYDLNTSRSGIRIFGTDARGVGYQSELTSHRHIGSRFSRIQSDWADASISLALLKDHGLAGITAGMKNYFGAIHNPNKYHDDHCDPFVAEVFDAPPVRTRHILSVLDALVVQYHRGPAYHRRWAVPCGTMVFGVDPVAVDAVGWKIIESLRAKAGLPTLREESRSPGYLFTAEKMGLGTASSSVIETVEEELT